VNPIILICGNAGAGKDTVADMLGRATQGALIAQATPIKEFAKKVFGFSNESLFGPSDARNQPDARYDLNTDQGPMSWADVYQSMDEWANEFAMTHLNHLSQPEYDRAAQVMANWFGALMLEHGLVLQKSDEGYPMLLINNLNAPVLTPRRVLQTFGTEFGRAVDTFLWTNLALKTCQEALIDNHSVAIITDGRFRSEVLAVKKVGGTVVKIVTPTTGEKLNGHASETELDTIPDSWFDVILLNNKELGLQKLETVVRTELVHVVRPGPGRLPLTVGTVRRKV